MLIEYVLTRSRRNVSEAAGKRLIACKVAREVVVETRQELPETTAPDVEISPRTGKPKRRYKRRDMRAEDE